MDDLLTGVDKSILYFDEKSNIIHCTVILCPYFPLLESTYMYMHIYLDWPSQDKSAPNYAKPTPNY